MHLTSNGCVAIRFKMLTYCVYAPLLNLIGAIPLNVIYNFETASLSYLKKLNRTALDKEGRSSRWMYSPF